MGYFLFIDESGQDNNDSGYEVLAGIAIEDNKVWSFIQMLHALEYKHFGMRISNGNLELKGKKILKRKVFKFANQKEPIPVELRQQLAKTCIEKGKMLPRETPTYDELTALGQSKIEFVKDVLILCIQNHIKAFASIIDNSAQRPSDITLLRKDYSFLFERYFYFLEDKNSIGLIIFDELEKTKSHILVNQMEEYFIKTSCGRERSSFIIPEPLFVHSDLTSLIQIADLIAYIISWGVQICSMQEIRRSELECFANQVLKIRYLTYRENQEGESFPIWSFKVFDDLRPLSERT